MARTGLDAARVVSRIEAGVLTGLFFLLIGLGLAQIAARAVPGLSWPWIDGAMRANVLWLAVLGGVVATGRLRHTRIDVLERLLPVAAAEWLRRLVFVATALVCLGVTWIGLDIVALEYEFRKMAFLAVPNWIVQLVIPAGFAMMAARFMAWAFSPSPLPGLKR